MSQDTGLTTLVSNSFTENVGHRLENLVYLHLRRTFEKIYYFKETGECDFVVFDRHHAKLVVQVCHKIDDNNFDRELNGLLEAMKFFKLSTGTIVTTAQKDHFEIDGRVVELVPAHEFVISV